MKKTISFFICAIMFIMVSCGHSSIVDKIHEGKELSADDYNEMVNYMYEAMSEMEVINRTADPSDYDYLMSEINEIAEDYPYVPEFYSACMKAMNNGSPNFNQNTVDMQKFGRVVDCMARGWGRFW